MFNCKSYKGQELWVKKEVMLRVQEVVEPKALFKEIQQETNTLVSC